MLTILSLKSTPIVAPVCSGNRPQQNRKERQVFPTPASPTIITYIFIISFFNMYSPQTLKVLFGLNPLAPVGDAWLVTALLRVVSGGLEDVAEVAVLDVYGTWTGLDF